MIVRARIVSNAQLYLKHERHKSLQNLFSFAFSDIKKKADHFMCAATAILTLTDERPNSLLNANMCQEKQKEGSKMAKDWLELKQSFSLREKVIYNISQLQLNKTQNTQEILNLFSRRFKNIKSQSSTKDCVQLKELNNSGQQFFVFNPTFIFKELFTFFKNRWPQRKILMGNYGIGKSSNQLLANILTTYLFQFRKEGKEAEKDLQENILRNANFLTQMMGYTKKDLQMFKDNDKKLVKFIQQQLYKIPFVLYYSLPVQQQKQNRSLSEVGFTQKDFIKYLTEQEIQKLSKKTSFYFCKQIERICIENRIPMSLVIDQSQIYFSTLKQLLSFLQKIQQLQLLPYNKQIEETLARQRRGYLNLQNKAILYGQFLNRVASLFKTYPNVTLSCSENVEYPLYPSRLSSRQNPFTKYSYVFFNKQFSIDSFTVNYGRNSKNQVWQRDMDLAFWFQLENALLNSFFQNDITKQQFEKSGKMEALNYLKYYYYYLVFLGEFKAKNFWSDAARHTHIHQPIKQIILSNKQSKERILIIQTIATIADQKQKMKNQQNQNKEVLSKFTQNLRELRQIVNKFCQEQHQKQVKKRSIKDQKKIKMTD